MSKPAVIYIFHNKTNGKRYVGQTTQRIERRLKDHHRKARQGSTTAFHNALRKYEAQDWEISVLDLTSLWGILSSQPRLVVCFLNRIEQHLIQHFRSVAPGGYNVLPGGSNREWTEEMKAEASERKKGINLMEGHRTNISEGLLRFYAKPENNLGQIERTERRWSKPGSRERQSEALKAHYATEENRAKQSERQIERWSDQAARKRQAEIQGPRMREEGKKRRKLTPEQVIEVFEMRKDGLSYAKIAARFGVSRSLIGFVIKGKTYQECRGEA